MGPPAGRRSIDFRAGRAVQPRKPPIGAAKTSGGDPIDRTKEIHFADVDAVVAEKYVRRHKVEIDVRDRDLPQIVLAANHLAAWRPAEADLALARSRVLRLFHALHKRDGLLDAGAYLADCLLVVFVVGRRLPREPGGCGFDIVASALNLIDEILHVRREAARQERVDVEFFRGGVLLSLVEPGFEILQGLRALRNQLVVHGNPSFSRRSVGEPVRSVPDDQAAMTLNVELTGPRDAKMSSASKMKPGALAPARRNFPSSRRSIATRAKGAEIA